MTNGIIKVLGEGRQRPSMSSDIIYDTNNDQISSYYNVTVTDSTTLKAALTQFQNGNYTRGNILLSSSGTTAFTITGSYEFLNRDLFIIGAPSGNQISTILTSYGVTIKVNNSNIYLFNLSLNMSSTANPLFFSSQSYIGSRFWGLWCQGCTLINSTGSSFVKNTTGGIGDVFHAHFEACNITCSTTTAFVSVTKNPANTYYGKTRVVVNNSIITGLFLGTSGTSSTTIDVSISNSKLTDGSPTGIFYNDPSYPATFTVHYSNVDSTVSQNLLSGSGAISYDRVDSIQALNTFTYFVSSKPTPTTIAHKGQMYDDGTYFYECVQGDGVTFGNWVRYSRESAGF